MGPRLPSRIGKLIPRLASPADGEVIATVRAIRRTLGAAGLDLHDLAAAITATEADAASARNLAELRDNPAEIAAGLLALGDVWSDREADFLRTMRRIGRRGWGRLSPAQRQWLLDLATEGAEA